MTHSPSSPPSPEEKPNHRLWLQILCRVGIGLTGLLVVGLGLGSWRLWKFIREDLAPLAQDGVTNTLNRPVELGAVQSFSLQGVRFGASKIPVTNDDPDFASIESVDVGFNIWELVWQRRLKLDVTLNNPVLYVEQDTRGRWLNTKISGGGKNRAIKTDLDRIWFRNGKVALVPSPQGNQTLLRTASPQILAAKGQPLSLENVNGNVQLLDNNRRLQIDVTAKPKDGDRLVVRGDIIPRTLASNLEVQAENIAAQDISNLIPLPLKLPTGKAWGNLKVEYEPKQTPLLYGQARVKDLSVEIPRVPRPFTQGSGNVRFDGTQVILDNTRAVYGRARFISNGVIDRRAGYNLTARTDVLSVKDVQETLRLKLPFVVTGNLRSELRLGGDIETPVLRGVVTTVNTAVADKVAVKAAQTQFEFLPRTGLVTFRDIQAVPMVGGKVTGSGQIQLVNNPQVNFNLLANNIPGDAIAQVYKIKSDIKIGPVAGLVQLTGAPNNVTTAVRWQAPQATYPGTGETIVNPNRVVDFRNVVLNVAGGRVQAVGQWQNNIWRVLANTQGIPIARFINTEKLENINLEHLNKSTLNGGFAIAGTTAPFQIAQISGQGGGVKIGGGQVPISSVKFTPSAFIAQFTAQGVQLSQILKQSQPVLANPLNGEFVITGAKENFDVKTLAGRGNAHLTAGGGTIAVNNIQLNDGNYLAQVNFNNNNVAALANVPPQVRNGQLTGAFNVAGTVDSFQIPDIQARGNARIDFGRGTITANNFTLANGRYNTNAIARNIPVAQFANLPPVARGALNGEFNVAGDATNIKLDNTLVTGTGRMNLAGGNITATNFKLAQGAYQTGIAARGIDLPKINPQLTGEFAGNLQLVGNVANPNIANTRAVGQVAFSQGLGGLNRPIQATIGWNGEKLIVNQATGKDFRAQGYIFANAKGSGTPEITQINLDVDTRNYPLANLPVKLPNNVTLAGVTDFRGQLTGTLPTPNLIGKVGVRNLKVANLAFEPQLQGNIRSERGKGLQLDINGQQDRIALNLDGNNQPQSFNVRWQQARAIGRFQNNTLQTQLENFPLAALNLTPPPNPYIGTGKIAGNLNGDLQINQKTLATSGNISIAQPQIGRITGDRLTANLNYSNGKLTLQDSAFQKANSTYAFAGSIQPRSSNIPLIQGKISARQGNIQDILTTLQIFNLNDLTRGNQPPDYGSAADLAVKPVGVANQPLLRKIQRHSEIQALLDQQQQARQAASPIPELADLKGNFNSEITLDTTNPQAYAAQFQFLGNDFTWGKPEESNRYFQAQRVIVEGQFEDNMLTLRPLRIESNNRLIAFNGTLGIKEQLGQLQVTNFPLQRLSGLIRLPNGLLAGNINANASISGNIFNPQATGEINISDGLLNQKGIKSASAGFNYSNGQLNFGSQVDVTGSKPVTIDGTIPYALPFASVSSPSDNINLNVNVQNEGLAVINLLTNQIAYESGAGSVDVKVGGTLANPKVEGLASLDKATFTAQALPGKITDLTGQIKFDRDRIIIPNLGGNFSRGRVEAGGEIPISQPASDPSQIKNPLTVNLDRLALNLKGIYQGGISGGVKITGSALDPTISGDIKLSNGQVFLAESVNTNNALTQTKSLQSELIASLQNNQNPFIAQAENSTRFQDLYLTLGDNLRISRPPILSFRATGQLKLSGTLRDPIPEGEIRLRDGDVNLFTTRFSLARGYKHTAKFRATQPRDPDLDIQLFSKVLDVVQSPDITPLSTSAAGFDTFQNSDVRLSNLGLTRLESVRIEANIQGPASQLDRNLELRSSPSRSQNEIVALLGGGFADTPAGESSSLGLINIAGSAVFNNFQSAFSQIGTAFGLSEFRIFPTLLSEDLEAGRSGSSLELAAEAGVDINPRFSLSFLKILTADDPFQWGLNYRINRELRLRGSTNFFDENRAVLEFERRF